METEFGQGFSVEELFIKKALGICTKRDSIAYQSSLNGIKRIVQDFRYLEEQAIKEKYNITKESEDSKVINGIRNIKEFGIKEEFLEKLHIVHWINDIHTSLTSQKDLLPDLFMTRCATLPTKTRARI